MKKIFFDIDGVLVNEDTGEVAYEVIEACGTADIECGVATARDYPGVIKIFDSFSRQGALILENGAVIVADGGVYFFNDARSILCSLRSELLRMGVALRTVITVDGPAWLPDPPGGKYTWQCYRQAKNPGPHYSLISRNLGLS